MTNSIHELKTWPGPFAAAKSGAKTYEIRVADRRYATGNFLVLREWTPAADPTEAGSYTGSFSVYLVTHMTEGGAWGLPAQLVVLGIKNIPILQILAGSPLGEVVGRIAHLALAHLDAAELDRYMKRGRELLSLEPEAEAEPGDEELELIQAEGCAGCPVCTSSGDGRPGMPHGRIRFN
jgi:hypothetical protein